MTNLVWLLLVLPVASAAALLLVGRRRGDAWGHLLGCATPLASFALGAALFVDMLSRHGEERAVRAGGFSRVPVAGLQIDFGLQLDQLSMCFVLLITGVGSLIHMYSVGYMAEDPDRRRFFAYINLFLAAMLLLVLADNFLGLYVGWEGVGLAFYLLIGFWHHKPSAATAAKKAFVVNRVGDIGLAVAMMVMFASFGTISFAGTSRRRTRAIRSFGGVQKVAPVLAGTFLVAGLATLSLPGLAPFVSEFLVLLGTFNRYQAAAVVASSALVLSAIYILWLYQRTMTGPVTAGNERVRDLAGRELVVVAPLIVLLLVLGVYKKPALDVINPAVSHTLTTIGQNDPAPTAVAK